MVHVQMDRRPAETSASVSGEVARVAAVVGRSVVGVRGSEASSGSGVVWNDRGLVITNHHVVPGGRAEVVLADGRRLAARVVRREEALDLAALELEETAPALVPAAIGDSVALRVGELVVAVGNPLGERNAATLGVVSGTPRPGAPLRVAITLWPGNSGGALADASGRVVGIPNMVIGPGQGLAVASGTVRRFLEQPQGAAGADGVTWV